MLQSIAKPKWHIYDMEVLGKDYNSHQPSRSSYLQHDNSFDTNNHKTMHQLDYTNKNFSRPKAVV
jgi:hypothetical protein